MRFRACYLILCRVKNKSPPASSSLRLALQLEGDLFAFTCIHSRRSGNRSSLGCTVPSPALASAGSHHGDTGTDRGRGSSGFARILGCSSAGSSPSGQEGLSRPTRPCWESGERWEVEAENGPGSDQFGVSGGDVKQTRSSAESGLDA